MLEEMKVKLKSRNSETKEPLDYEITFIVKKKYLPKVMEVTTGLLSFQHHDDSPKDEL